jgi:hypothetical protein
MVFGTPGVKCQRPRTGNGGSMRRDQLLETDLLSELLLLVSGVSIFVGLVAVLVAAVASTGMAR